MTSDRPALVRRWALGPVLALLLGAGTALPAAAAVPQPPDRVPLTAAAPASAIGSAAVVGAVAPENLSVAAAAGATAARAQPPVPDGRFVQLNGDPRVFLVVGGSLIYVDSWGPFGGVQPITTIQWDVLGRMNPAPADGTFVRTADLGRVYRFAGGAPVHVDSWAPFGGPQPTQVIPARAVSEAGSGPWYALRKAPADGTFVATAGEGRVHRYVGGAAVYIDSWAQVGGVQPFTWVSPRAVSAAGTGLWSGMRRAPVDGAFVTRGSGGDVYGVVGGAFVHVGDWWSLDSCPDGLRETEGGPCRTQPTVALTRAAIDNAGAGMWADLRATPRDGTFVRAGGFHYFRYVDGAALFVESWAPFGGPQPFTVISWSAVERAGQGKWSNLRRVPRDGTFVATVGEGRVYQFIGGAPIYVDSWAPFGGVRPYTWVAPSSVLRDPFLEPAIRPAPVDGTFVRTAEDGKIYRYAGGVAHYVSDWAPFGGVQPYSTVTVGAVTQAGRGPWSTLPARPWDGAFITTTDGRVYRYVGGAAIYISDLGPFYGTGNSNTVVSAGAVDSAGEGPWSNLRKTPVDGARFVEPVTGAKYQVIGGSPVWIDQILTQGGIFVMVNTETFTQTGTGRWSNLRSVPADGTALHLAGVGFYEVRGGRLVALPGRPATGATLVPGALLSGAGTGRWWGFLPPE